MAHKLMEFTADTIGRMERAWVNDLNHAPDIFPGDVFRLISFAKQNSNYVDGGSNSLAYGVFSDDSHVADSIVQVIVTKEGKKIVKMLDCLVRPSISEKALKFDDAAIESLVEIYIASIVGTIALGDHHKANAIKVYGRTAPLLTVLTIVSRELKKHKAANDLVKTSIEGRWLVVRPTKKGK